MPLYTHKKNSPIDTGEFFLCVYAIGEGSPCRFVLVIRYLNIGNEYPTLAVMVVLAERP